MKENGLVKLIVFLKVCKCISRTAGRLAQVNLSNNEHLRLRICPPFLISYQGENIPVTTRDVISKTSLYNKRSNKIPYMIK